MTKVLIVVEVCADCGDEWDQEEMLTAEDGKRICPNCAIERRWHGVKHTS